MGKLNVVRARLLKRAREETARRFTDLMVGLCQNNCGRRSAAPHPCPFKSDINDDATLCNCCEGCTQECADDI